MRYGVRKSYEGISMRTVFDGSFDRQLTFCLYKSYMSSKSQAVLNELLKQIAPLINQVARKKISDKCLDEDPFVLKGDALSKIFTLLKSGKVITDNAIELDSCLRSVTYNSFMDSIKGMKSDLPDSYEIEVRLCHSQVETIKRVDQRLTARKLVEYIYRLVIAEIRFSGSEELACRFITACKLGVTRKDYNIAEKVYGIGRNKFKRLDKYTDIIIKSVAYDAKELLGN
jgi:hypothetical protein